MLDITTDIYWLGTHVRTCDRRNDKLVLTTQLCVHAVTTSHKEADSRAGEQGGRGPQHAPSRPVYSAPSCYTCWRGLCSTLVCEDWWQTGGLTSTDRHTYRGVNGWCHRGVRRYVADTGRFDPVCTVHSSRITNYIGLRQMHTYQTVQTVQFTFGCSWWRPMGSKDPDIFYAWHSATYVGR